MDFIRKIFYGNVRSIIFIYKIKKSLYFLRKTVLFELCLAKKLIDQVVCKMLA